MIVIYAGAGAEKVIQKCKIVTKYVTFNKFKNWRLGKKNKNHKDRFLP
jgi:hypothetical protein